MPMSTCLCTCLTPCLHTCPYKWQHARLHTCPYKWLHTCLDFLKNKRGRLGVDFVGVAANEDFGKTQTAGAALRSVRKLRDFMNISYPIATDAGTQIKKFGDPRALGAELPLWVVIGPDGKIAHYHVGFYSIKPDEGLKPLDDVLIDLIRKQRAAAE